jgi:hypothetical protein
VVVEGKEPIPVSVVLEPSEVANGADDLGAEVAEGRAHDRRMDGTASPRRWPWGMVVVGAASLLGGAGFHLAALSSRDAAADLYSGGAFDAELERFEFRRAMAIGLYAGGAVLTAAGVWLLSRRGGDRAKRGVGVSLVPTEGGAALWLRVVR